MQPILMMMPAICADITDRYHDDWLKDIILILAFAIRFVYKNLILPSKVKCTY